MSSVLFISDDEMLRVQVKAILTAAHHEVTTSGADDYQPFDRNFDCTVVDSGARSVELISLFKWSRVGCILGVYETEEEHLGQLAAGALWSIPAITNIADQLKDGPKSIEMAVGVLMFARPTGDWKRDRLRAGLAELLCGFKNPKE